MAKWLKVGTVMSGKEGKGSYVKIDNPVNLQKGQTLSVFDPRKNKKLTEEQIAKIPSFIKFELFLVENN